jgi:hypothetical protein
MTQNHTQESHQDLSKPIPSPTEWQKVSPKHLLRSDTQRKDIQKIAPQLELFINKKTETKGTTRLEQWQVTNFRKLKAKIDNTDPADLKVCDICFKLRTLARSIGQGALFDPKKVPTPQKGSKPKHMPSQFSPVSLDEEFEENQDKEFDMESLESNEDPMPDLHQRA